MVLVDQAPTGRATSSEEDLPKPFVVLAQREMERLEALSGEQFWDTLWAWMWQAEIKRPPPTRTTPLNPLFIRREDVVRLTARTRASYLAGYLIENCRNPDTSFNILDRRRVEVTLTGEPVICVSERGESHRFPLSPGLIQHLIS